MRAERARCRLSTMGEAQRQMGGPGLSVVRRAVMLAGGGGRAV